MSLLTFKILAALLIFIVATIAGLLPIKMSHFHEDSHHFTDSLTNGIFLGAALFHMIPDAQEGFQAVGFNHYPYAILLCFSGFILLQIIKYMTLYFKHSTEGSKFNGVMILIVLCIHSIIEGATLGINTTISNTFVIFIAIIAHKSCDSFALASTLKRYDLFMNRSTLMIIIYALLTPFGIALAGSIMGVLSHRTGILVESSLNALAAGTFIYIGALDTLIQQFQTRRIKQKIMDFVAVIIGMGLMGLLAVWI